MGLTWYILSQSAKRPFNRLKSKLRRTGQTLFYGLPECKYPEEWKIGAQDRLLILSPHPDDESIGCGGLLLNYGSQCDVVCLTDGRHGDDTLEPTETAAIRKGEFETVMQILGVNSYCCLEIEDLRLIEHYKVFQQIDLTAYDYVLSPALYDNHPDHRAASILLEKLITSRKISRIKTVYYEVWSALFAPTHYIDISDMITKKSN